MESISATSWPETRQGPTILIVDDDDAIRDFLRSAFEAEGYDVLAAEDGEAALMLCEGAWPSFILLDLMMPRLDGIGFLHEFRRRYGSDAAPIYVMSAVRTVTLHAQAVGVMGAFLKPFDLDDLLQVVAALVPPGIPATGVYTPGNEKTVSQPGDG